MILRDGPSWGCDYRIGSGIYPTAQEFPCENGPALIPSFLNAVRELFDYRVGQNLAGDAFHLRLGSLGRESIDQ